MTVLPLSPTTISDVQAGDYPYTPRSKCIAQTWDFCALEQRSPGAIVRCPRIGVLYDLVLLPVLIAVVVRYCVFRGSGDPLAGLVACHLVVRP
jgi:hypothetical protein